jgi:hypothetical protein
VVAIRKEVMYTEVTSKTMTHSKEGNPALCQLGIYLLFQERQSQAVIFFSTLIHKKHLLLKKKKGKKEKKHCKLEMLPISYRK